MDLKNNRNYNLAIGYMNNAYVTLIDYSNLLSNIGADRGQQVIFNQNLSSSAGRQKKIDYENMLAQAENEYQQLRNTLYSKHQEFKVKSESMEGNKRFRKHKESVIEGSLVAEISTASTLEQAYECFNGLYSKLMENNALTRFFRLDNKDLEKLSKISFKIECLFKERVRQLTNEHEIKIKSINDLYKTDVEGMCEQTKTLADATKLYVVNRLKAADEQLLAQLNVCLSPEKIELFCSEPLSRTSKKIYIGELFNKFEDIQTSQYPEGIFSALYPSIYVNGQFQIPLSLSLDSNCSLSISYNIANKQRVIKLAQFLTMQILQIIDSDLLSFNFADLTDSGAMFSPFMKLMNTKTNIIKEKVATNVVDFTCQLDDIIKHIDHVSQMIFTSSSSDETIFTYNESHGQKVPYKFLIAHDVPMEFNADIYAKLSKILKNGPRCGVFTILLFNISADEQNYRDNRKKFVQILKEYTEVLLFESTLPVVQKDNLSFNVGILPVNTDVNAFVANYIEDIKQHKHN